jgi:hypothetical protein
MYWLTLVGRFKIFSTIYGEKCRLFFRHFSLKKWWNFETFFTPFQLSFNFFTSNWKSGEKALKISKTNDIFHHKLCWKIWISQPVSLLPLYTNFRQLSSLNKLFFGVKFFSLSRFKSRRQVNYYRYYYSFLMQLWYKKNVGAWFRRPHARDNLLLTMNVSCKLKVPVCAQLSIYGPMAAMVSSTCKCTCGRLTHAPTFLYRNCIRNE